MGQTSSLCLTTVWQVGHLGMVEFDKIVEPKFFVVVVTNDWDYAITGQWG
jgi:hypothetical protein